MTITIECDEGVEASEELLELIRKVVIAACDHEKCEYEAEVNVTLTDNANIQEMNRDFRGIDSATDVLSFPLIEYEAPADFSHVEDPEADCFNPDSGELMLGDIVISLERAAEQAENYGHSFEREVGFLTAHSMLHLMGYDHIEDSERLEMEKRQEEILQNLGITRD
ncbi:MAG: rRNA maturation RNase YbeY [Lachnospiraceae bacterium]|nr:rRNA maturation RNase YbeY [Lachnospiraceae bacterium]